MSKTTVPFTLVLQSPAAPAAVLLYGIVFLLATAYFIGIPWRRVYTLALYLGVLVWATVVAVHRFKARRPIINRMDLFFAVFFGSILLSVAITWWEGNIRYFELMPVFFLAPYVLGRMMNVGDVRLLIGILLGMGTLLLPLIFLEFWRVLEEGLPYVNSPNPMLFGLGHGVMLSGLILSAAFLSALSISISSGNRGTSSPLSYGAFVNSMLVLFVITMGWIASRGPILAGVAGMVILLLLSPKSGGRQKLQVLTIFFFALTIAVAHSLNRAESRAYYTAIVQIPVITERLVDSTIGLGRSADRPGLVLGEAACKTIIDSVSDRWVHYRQALALFVSKPIFGVGSNQYGFHACTGPGSFPHSTLLQVLAELGIVGGVLYCALIGMTFHVLLRSRLLCAAPSAEPTWTWLVAFAAIQFLAAQLNGNYFVSAGLYFVMGIAAGVLDRPDNTTEGD